MFIFSETREIHDGSFVSFLCYNAVLSDGDFPNFRGEFLLQSSEKKTEASNVSGTFRNFYMAARCDMPEGSKLFVL